MMGSGASAGGICSFARARRPLGGRMALEPVILDQFAVPAFRLAASGGDDLQAIRPRLEAARHLRRDARRMYSAGGSCLS